MYRILSRVRTKESHKHLVFYHFNVLIINGNNLLDILDNRISNESRICNRLHINLIILGIKGSIRDEIKSENHVSS